MTETRKRAPGMNPDERRHMIVQAALPLLAEYGPAVTTQQIARAAGIGEATIFRVFPDKDAVLRACVAEVLRPDHVLRELASVDREQEIEGRLVDAAEALAAHFARIGAVVAPLAGALRAEQGERRAPDGGREASAARTTAAIVELLEPDADRFRLPLEQAAATFGQLAMSPYRGAGAVDPKDLVDLFLNGALTR